MKINKIKNGIEYFKVGATWYSQRQFERRIKYWKSLFADMRASIKRGTWKLSPEQTDLYIQAESHFNEHCNKLNIQ